jgi:hypothetical protein
MLRHGVLGQDTQIHRIGRDAVAELRALDEQRRRLEEQQ